MGFQGLSFLRPETRDQLSHLLKARGLMKVSKGSQPEIVAAAFLILCMTRARPFLYQVLIATQLSVPFWGCYGKTPSSPFWDVLNCVGFGHVDLRFFGVSVPSCGACSQSGLLQVICYPSCNLHRLQGSVCLFYRFSDDFVQSRLQDSQMKVSPSFSIRSTPRVPVIHLRGRVAMPPNCFAFC